MLLAIILAFALYHWVQKPVWMLDFGWQNYLNRWLEHKVSLSSEALRLLLVVGLACGLLYFSLKFLSITTETNNLGYLLFSVMVLFYCLGPQTISQSIKDNSLFKLINSDNQSSTRQTIDTISDAALHRWFGILVWYMFLGLWGALGYRIIERGFNDEPKDAKLAALSKKICRILDFPAAVLMVLALAVASDFESVWKKCKPFINKETLRTLNTQFLYQAMEETIERRELTGLTTDMQQQVTDACLSVLKRMLIACLVLLAILLLFSVR